jgi:hypothetical protein
VVTDMQARHVDFGDERSKDRPASSVSLMHFHEHWMNGKTAMTRSSKLL